MIGLIVRRLLVAVFLLIGATLCTFILIELAPGDYFDKLRMNPHVGDEIVQQLEEQYGLDEDPVTRFGHWLHNVSPVGTFSHPPGETEGGIGFVWNESEEQVVRVGLKPPDLGRSFQKERPVLNVVAEAFVNTVYLMVAAILLTWLLALPMGIYCAVHHNEWGDRIVSGLAFVGLSIPNFFLCMVVMWLVAEYAELPVGGMTSVYYDRLPWYQQIGDRIAHMIIPVVVIATGSMAGLQRITRSRLLESLRKQYITTARARGLPEDRVVYRHALRNAINPLITIFGYQFSRLVGGAALVEIVYGWPGMGSLILEAVMSQDLFLVVGTVLFSGMLLIIGNLVADILLAVNDPRIQFGERGAA